MCKGDSQGTALFVSWNCVVDSNCDRNSVIMNIGDKVNYSSEYGEKISGEIVEVLSDMDSYENMKLKDGIAYYWSKKMNKYAPVKEKNIKSVFLEIKTFTGVDFIEMNEVIIE